MSRSLKSAREISRGRVNTRTFSGAESLTEHKSGCQSWNMSETEMTEKVNYTFTSKETDRIHKRKHANGQGTTAIKKSQHRPSLALAVRDVVLLLAGEGV